MNIQVEVSLYPLRKDSLEEPINSFAQHLRKCGFSVTVGPMSSHISGESGRVFEALAEAFDEAAGNGDVVLTMKASNACPHRLDNTEAGGNCSRS